MGPSGLSGSFFPFSAPRSFPVNYLLFHQIPAAAAITTPKLGLSGVLGSFFCVPQLLLYIIVRVNFLQGRKLMHVPYSSTFIPSLFGLKEEFKVMNIVRLDIGRHGLPEQYTLLAE